jgi:DNA invertase Pin-like site-specific DNA recombinase
MSAATSQGVIYAERVSAVAEREQLHLALDFCRAGDVLVVTKLDRLARGVADLCKPALILYGLGRALRYVLSNE